MSDSQRLSRVTLHNILWWVWGKKVKNISKWSQKDYITLQGVLCLSINMHKSLFVRALSRYILYPENLYIVAKSYVHNNIRHAGFCFFYVLQKYVLYCTIQNMEDIVVWRVIRYMYHNIILLMTWLILFLERKMGRRKRICTVHFILWWGKNKLKSIVHFLIINLYVRPYRMYADYDLPSVYL